MKKILVIEDSDEIRDNTAEILELANYRVFTAANGKEGIEIARKEKPDLIICDIMMPVLDGYGVLHLLHQNPELRNTPFIFLTAKSERNEMRKGMELGADDYITKPFDETELLHAIESRFRKAVMQKTDTETEEETESTNGKEVLAGLAANRNVNKYKKKQVIYSEGNRPSRLYFIQKGKVKTYKMNEEGKELVIDLYSEGEFLGYTALLEGGVYKETAEALENTELALIPKEDFDLLLSTDCTGSRQFAALLAKKMTEKNEQLLGLAYNSLRKKVAEALLSLCKKYDAGITISRGNLAAIAGTAPESLIRTLGDFKAEKLIDIKKGIIIIQNEKKLQELIS
ncbi:MAG TPA: response regulator [Chitinophagaceae bacterium]|jgi:CheY-like chemotaxis protein|nr:response regulator [Chitinophagaceae bacterium]